MDWWAIDETTSRKHSIADPVNGSPPSRLMGTNLGRLGIRQLRQAAKARPDFLPDR